jgi:hypothetical protein
VNYVGGCRSCRCYDDEIRQKVRGPDMPEEDAEEAKKLKDSLL